MKSKSKEKLKGGLADNMSDKKFNKKQLKAGVKVEKEHTKDPKAAKEVAKDHLVEISDYYDRLDEMEQKAKKDVKKSFARANDLIKSLKESLKTEDMDLKKTGEEDVDKGADAVKQGEGMLPLGKKLVQAGADPGGPVSKALKASSIAGLSRRQRMDAAYRAGIALGRQLPFTVEKIELVPEGLGISPEHLRPDYEPPAVPARRVETPFEIAPKKCGDHTYKTAKTGPVESKPIWRR